ncbi:hypothetical protein [Pedobacter aquatilis]|uniref:hypothetical protein n=1 Tax=Pedobacter aquatilis TaxID=351343 RepID=UPI002930524F|nr:hypothetical protein [Pedobacter aquatilis]
MKYLYLTLALSISVFSIQAQEKKEEKSKEENNSELKQEKLNVLRAQSSPASSLLGFAVSDIEKPTDVSDFMVSLQSASSSYTKLPSNYAVDLAPFYLFRKKGADFSTTGKKGLQSEDPWDVFRQSFVVSLGLRNPDSSFNNFKSTSTYGALGVKFSIVRPKYSEDSKKKLQKIRDKQEMLIGIYSEEVKKRVEESDRYKKLEAREKTILDSIRKIESLSELDKVGIISVMQADKKSELYQTIKARQDMLNKFPEELKKEIENNKPKFYADLEDLAKSFDGNRQGLSVDIAGGLSSEFRQKRFDNSKIFNSGVWATFGYNWKDGSSILGLARYLYNPDEIFALNGVPNTMGDISTFDAGLKYVLLKGKFGAGAEAIYRSILSSSTVKPSWRLAINADYEIAANQKLIFTFGRNYDGTVTKDGNLIAALTVVFGLGTAR